MTKQELIEQMVAIATEAIHPTNEADVRMAGGALFTIAGALGGGGMDLLLDATAAFSAGALEWLIEERGKDDDLAT